MHQMNSYSSQNLIANRESSFPSEEEKKSSQKIIKNYSVEGSKEQLEDLLTCHVCFCQVSNPVMCPFCSKLYCENCIRRCLSMKAECPHCRKSIKGVSMMANCNRFINDLMGIVHDLIQNKAKQQICPEHEVKIDYFCENCSIPVCCQCQMFGSHKGHTLKKLQIIYQARYNVLRQMLTEFKTKLKQKEIAVKQVENQLNEVQKLKDKHIKELEEFTQSYRIKIIQETNAEAAQLQNKIKFYDDLLVNLENLEGQLSQRADQAERNGKYYLEDDFLKKIHDITEQELIPHRPHPSVLQQVIPPYFSSKFVITDFSKKKRDKSIIYSPIQKYEGSEWRLKIYPNGNETVEGSYMSIFIEMVSTIHESTVYEYQIEMLNRKNPSLRMIRQYQSTFEPGQCWGYNKYIKVQNLTREGYVDPRTDQLQIIYYIRNPFYHSIYKQKQSYIVHLDSQLSLQQKQIQELQELLAKSQTEGKNFDR